MSTEIDGDSPLSIAANIAGILTFVYALLAGLLGYLYLFRSSSPASIERFYEAFAACALESDLVRRDILAARSGFVSPAPPPPLSSPTTGRSGTDAGSVLIPDSVPRSLRGSNSGLGKAAAILASAAAAPILSSSAPSHGPVVGLAGEDSMDPDSLSRLFSHVRAAEIELQNQAAKVVTSRPTGEEGVMSTLLGRGRWASRARELEASLVKREALTGRLLVVQMSLFSS